MAQLKIDLIVDDKGSIVVKNFGGNVAKSMDTAGGSFDGFGRRVGLAGAAVTGLVGVLGGVVGLVGGNGLRVFADLEEKLIGVQKTTDFTASEMDTFGNSITEMGRRLPVATGSLLEIAGVAGQLGIKGVDNITNFTETMGKLALATDVVGADGAASIARLLNVTGEGVETIDSFGAVLVALGNNSAATESEILGMATQIGQATAAFSVGSTEALAMGAAMKSIGVQAELGGSVVGRSMRAIEASIAAGGEQITQLSQVTGIAEKDLRQAFGDNATLVFNKFLHGIGGMIEGGNTAAESLELFGLKGDEVLKVLPTMAVNTGVFDDALRLANDELERGTALNDEAAKAGEGLSAQLQVVGNITTEMAFAIGEELAPQVKDMVAGFTDWWAANDKIISQDVAGSIAELATVVSDNKESIFALFTGMINLSAEVIQAISNITDSFRGFSAVGEGRLSFFQFATMDAKELDAWLQRDKSGLVDLDLAMGKLADKRQDVANSFAFTSQQRKDKEARLQAIDDEINALKLQQTVIVTTEKVTRDEALDSWRVKTDLSNKMVATTTTAGEAIINQSKKVASDTKSIVSKSVTDQQKLAEDLTDKINRLTLSEYQYKVKTLDAEIDKMRGVAGTNEKLQNDITAYRRSSLDKMSEYGEMYSKDEQKRLDGMTDSWMLANDAMAGHTSDTLASIDSELDDYFGELDEKSKNSTGAMADDWQHMAGEAKSTFGTFADDMFDENKSIGEAWSDLWRGMLSTVVTTVAEMVAEYAVGKVAGAAIDWVFSHDGTVSVKDDEQATIIQKGQMIVPRDDSDVIRDNLAGSGNTFDNLVTASYLYSRNGSEAPGYDPGDTGMFGVEGAIKGVANITSKSALRSFLGAPQNVGFDLANFGIGQIGSIGGVAVDSMAGIDPSAYSNLGHPAGRLAGGYFGGTIGGVIGGMFGGLFGDAIGDMFNDRDFEGLRDATEDGTISGLEKSRFKAEARRMGITDPGNLGGFVGLLGDLGKAAMDALGVTATLDTLSDLAQDLGYSIGISNYSSDFGSDGYSGGPSSPGDSTGIGQGVGGMSGMDPGKGGEDWEEGGKPSTVWGFGRDDGFVSFKRGEGIISETGMRNLDKLNASGIDTPASSLSDELKQILLSIAVSTNKMAKILQRFEYTGIPESNTKAVA